MKNTVQESAESYASFKQSPGGEIQEALFQVFGARARHHWMQIEQKMRTRQMQEWASLTYGWFPERVSVRNEKSEDYGEEKAVKWKETSKPSFNGMNVLSLKQKLTLLPIVPVIIRSPDDKNI